MLAAIGEDLLDSPVQSQGNDEDAGPKIVTDDADKNNDSATKSQQLENHSEQRIDDFNEETEFVGDGALNGVAATQPENNNNVVDNEKDQSDADDGAFF